MLIFLAIVILVLLLMAISLVSYREGVKSGIIEEQICIELRKRNHAELDQNGNPIKYLGRFRVTRDMLLAFMDKLPSERCKVDIYEVDYNGDKTLGFQIVEEL